MDHRPFLLPASIVVAGGLVGAGLFFGLRARAPDAGPAGVGVAPVLVASAPSRTTPAPPPEEPARALPPGVTPEKQAAIDRRAAEAVARERPRLVRECWAPSAQKSAEPATLDVAVRFLFDKDGKQLDMSVADAADPRRADVTACVRRSGIVAAVDPPGTMVATQLQISFP